MRTAWMVGLLAGCWSCLGLTVSGEVVPLRKLSRSQQEVRVTGDLKAVLVYRQGLESVTQFARRQTNLFPVVPRTEVLLPPRAQKEVLWQAWKMYLDYLLALDALDHYHREFYRLSGKRRAGSFLAGYMAFLAKYRFGMEFIEAAEKNPVLDTILNEPVPELGMPAGTYARVKYRFLNVMTATDFAAQSAIYKVTRTRESAEHRRTIEADVDFILEMGRGKGEVLTARNGLKILQKAGDNAWFPVQAGVAEWMGDTKVYRPGRSLISPSQIRQLRPQLAPGDVLLVRREWYLSNIGLPGFWPHAALYIGTPDERRRFFADPEVADWVRGQGISTGDLEDLLKSRYAETYARSLKTLERRHKARILEAMSAGVSFTSLEHSADADSLVVLRPLLAKTEKAAALLRAFHYAGRPYDFRFDFATDAELVCTELVYKAYEPAPGRRGLRLPLVTMLGRQLLPANEIARLFSAEYGKADRQFRFITFLDGQERGRKAVEAGVEQFRESWRRPKWHVVVQGE